MTREDIDDEMRALFLDLHKQPNALLTEADVAVMFELSKHPAIQSVLSRAVSRKKEDE